MFVFEPWLAEGVWSAMGCGDSKSEIDCVALLGQDEANAVFQAHWEAFITEDDFSQMRSYGLNTVRIPVGYWVLETLVFDSESFPQGGASYLEKVCGWASDAGLYIIIDMHGAPGAPGAQVATNPDTGQYVSEPGFYETFQFARGIAFLTWLTTQIHTSISFRNVGMIGIVNEPAKNLTLTTTMLSDFYPDAYDAIRLVELGLGVGKDNHLHIQTMDTIWGSGNPAPFLKDTFFTARDDHCYYAYNTVINATHSSFLSASCNADFSNGDTPTVVGEFSLAVPSSASGDWDPDTQQEFYAKWFAAQITNYEKYTLGWVFWTWKTQLQGYRLSYQAAVTAGVIPTDLDSVYHLNVCDGY